MEAAEAADADWLVRAATVLGIDPLGDDELTALLDVARDVAHNTERRYAPLTCFLLGAATAGDRSGLVEACAELAGMARGEADVSG